MFTLVTKLLVHIMKIYVSYRITSWYQ